MLAMDIVALFLALSKPKILSLFPFDLTLPKNATLRPFPPPSLTCKMSIHSLPSFCAPNFAHNSVPEMKLHSANFAVFMHCRKGFLTLRKHDSIPVGCGAKDSKPKEEHTEPMETVLKLYEAIKHRNVDELSDFIADECTCCSNIISAFQPCYGKKEVLAFFSSLMKKLGNNIEFVVQPTLDNGMAVGLYWKLEWNKVPVSLGKGFSLYMCHAYKGSVVIKNVEIFMEPLLHMEPLRLKVIGLLMTAMEKLDPRALFKNHKGRKAKTVIFFFLLLLAGIWLVFKIMAST